MTLALDKQTAGRDETRVLIGRGVELVIATSQTHPHRHLSDIAGRSGVSVSWTTAAAVSTYSGTAVLSHLIHRSLPHERWFLKDELSVHTVHTKSHSTYHTYVMYRTTTTAVVVHACTSARYTAVVLL